MGLAAFNRRRREIAAQKAAEEKAQRGDFGQMTVAELRDYAARYEIDITGRRKKNDIIMAILESQEGE